MVCGDKRIQAAETGITDGLNILTLDTPGDGVLYQANLDNEGDRVVSK